MVIYWQKLQHMKNLKEISKLTELPFKVEELQSEHTYLFVTDCLDECSYELWQNNVIQLSKILHDFGVHAVFLDKKHFGDISIYKLEKDNNSK